MLNQGGLRCQALSRISQRMLTLAHALSRSSRPQKVFQNIGLQKCLHLVHKTYYNWII